MYLAKTFFPLFPSNWNTWFTIISNKMRENEEQINSFKICLILLSLYLQNRKHSSSCHISIRTSWKHRDSQTDKSKIEVRTGKAKQRVPRHLLPEWPRVLLGLGRPSQSNKVQDGLSQCLLAVVTATANWTAILAQFLFLLKEDTGFNSVLHHRNI